MNKYSWLLEWYFSLSGSCMLLLLFRPEQECVIVMLRHHVSHDLDSGIYLEKKFWAIVPEWPNWLPSTYCTFWLARHHEGTTPPGGRNLTYSCGVLSGAKNTQLQLSVSILWRRSCTFTSHTEIRMCIQNLLNNYYFYSFTRVAFLIQIFDSCSGHLALL